MTRFVSTRYPSLRIPALRVRFTDGRAAVSDPDVAARLASWPTPGVDLAPGEHLPDPDDGGDQDENTPEPDDPGRNPAEDGDGQGDGGEPKRPAKTAPKSAWVSYVLATYDVDRAEVDGMTKDQLMQLAED